MSLLRKIAGRNNVIAVSMVLMVSAFPALFLYLKNAGQVGIGEILQPLLLLLGMGGLLFLLCYLLLRNVNKAALTAALFAVTLGNFKVIESGFEMLFRSMRYWHVLPVVLLFILLLSNLLIKRIPDELCDILVKVFGGVVLVLVVINLATAIPGIVKYVEAHSASSATENKGDGQTSDSGLPNVYILLFDEYAGFEQMQEYYSYENEEFRNFLKENHFNISESSHNEYYLTDVCITNLMNLEYMVLPTVELADAERIRKSGRLFDVMRELGYQVQVVESGNFLGQDSPTRDTTGGSAGTINGETIADLCLKQTVLYPFVQGYTNASLSEILEVCAYISEPENIPQTPTFTVFYVAFPHQPFLVDENGNKLPSSAYVNWADDQYYLGQYKYCTKIMQQILENLVTNDPESVIFVQSDHGARASGSDLYKKKFSEESMTGIFNVLYMQGEEINYIEGKSAINTVRLVLDELYDLGLGEVEVPDYLTKENEK